MFQKVEKVFSAGECQVELQTGVLARSSYSVLSKINDTVVISSFAVSTEPEKYVSFTPFSVHYIEKSYAGGKIPGGFYKREGKPSESELIISRLIDRSIRPLFPAGFSHVSQLTSTVLSYGSHAEAELCAFFGCIAAVGLSGIKFENSIAPVSVVCVDGKYLCNVVDQSVIDSSSMHITSACSKDGNIIMIESKSMNQLDPEIVTSALECASQKAKDITKEIESFIELGRKSLNKNIEYKEASFDMLAEVKKLIQAKFLSKIKKGLSFEDRDKQKIEIDNVLNSIKEEVHKKFDHYKEAYSSDEVILNNTISTAFKEVESEYLRERIILENKRLDGRSCDQIRPISITPNFLPKSKVHGSALFTRGETQSLSVLTLGGDADEQRVESLDGSDRRDSFLLHYNFPGFSVGEPTPPKPPGRREIGHGKLALKSLEPVVPSKEEFPYTIRLVSEILESNGSSSMATVCASSLALKSSGVPISNMVAGVAMGLVYDSDEKRKVITDISGSEDALGHVDFKIAGTESGLTGLQMDVKLKKGLSMPIMKEAISDGVKGYKYILGLMETSVKDLDCKMCSSVPQSESFKINSSKIAAVIGKQGSVIQGISQKFGVSIDIDKSGTVKVFGLSDNIKNAKNHIESIVQDVNIGFKCEGVVVKVIPNGAIFEMTNGHKGMLFANLIPSGVKVEEGQKRNIKVSRIDEKGRIQVLLDDGTEDSVDSNKDSHSSPSSSNDKPNNKKTYSRHDKSSSYKGSNKRPKQYNNSNSKGDNRRYNNRSKERSGSNSSEKKKGGIWGFFS